MNWFGLTASLNLRASDLLAKTILRVRTAIGNEKESQRQLCANLSENFAPQKTKRSPLNRAFHCAGIRASACFATRGSFQLRVDLLRQVDSCPQLEERCRPSRPAPIAAMSIHFTLIIAMIACSSAALHASRLNTAAGAHPKNSQDSESTPG
jgi:hypothetical protein